MTAPTARAVRRLLICLVLVHLAFVLVRAPRSVVHKRLGDVAAHRGLGAVRFHLDGDNWHGAEAVEWILEHVPEEAVVLHRGERRGVLELVPALIWPRLLVETTFVDEQARMWEGRPIAGGDLGSGRQGQLVVVGERDRVTLEVR